MKSVAIMQPYFFPYLGYFGLMNLVDEFVILDDVQFMRHGWIERNRIIKHPQGWIYFAVPLQKHNQKTLIKDISINNEINWKKKILDQLVVYKKIAPNYFVVRNWLESVLEPNFTSISELNFHILEKTRQFLEIDCIIKRFDGTSEIIEKISKSDDWALQICKLYNEPVTYINPEGGLEFFEKTKYADSEIPIYFFKQNLSQYRQGKGNEFESALSILDVMMFNSVSDIKVMLLNYQLL